MRRNWAFWAALVFAWPAIASGSNFTIPHDSLLAHPEFGVKAWGTVTIVSRTNVGGSAVDFALDNLSGGGSGVKDNFPVIPFYGQTGGLHNADFSNLDGYTIKAENRDDLPVDIHLFLNTGFTGESWTHDTFWAGPWFKIQPGQTVFLTLDFDYAEAWNISDNPPASGHSQGTNGGHYAINALDRTEVTAIGFEVADFNGGNPAATIRLTPATMPSVTFVDASWTGGQEGDQKWFSGFPCTFDFDAFATIQEGIDGVEGSTVNVGSGTYVEQVHINTDDLALVGAGEASTTIESPATLAKYFISSGTTKNYPVVFVDSATGVSISDLTVDGNGKGNTNVRFSGIGFWESGGSVSDVTVKRVMDTPFSGAQHGVGIYAYNTSGGPYAIALDDVEVFDFQKNAIALLGSGLTVDLDYVETTGEGPTTVTAQNGIQIGAGASGTVTDCTIRDVAYTGATWTATGFLPQVGGTVDATRVDIIGCQTGVYYTDTQGTFDDGSITDLIGDGFYAYNYGGIKKAEGNRPRVTAQGFDEELGSAIPLRSGMDVVLSNSTLTGEGVAYSWGAGVFGLASNVTLTVENCHISEWDFGLVAYDYGYGGKADLVASEDTLVDNDSYGIYADSGAVSAAVDAEDCWWGTVTGPYHPTLNPTGAGDPVSDWVDFKPWKGMATLGPDPATAGPINCSQSVVLDFAYAPDALTPAMRGYSVRVSAESEVSFDEGDITVYELPSGANEWVQISKNDDNDYTIDYVILGTTGGIVSDTTLFSIEFHGAATGTGTVSIPSATLRDLSNGAMGVDYSGTSDIEVDCTAPDLPAMDAEPAHTAGTSNTVSWSDESASGATAYYAECDDNADFSSVFANSGWIPGLSHEFTGLTDAVLYHYRVKTKDALGNESGWSTSVFSTQDDTDPISSADALPAYTGTLTFDVAYSANDATSGVASVELFYQVDGGGYVSYGTSTSSPFSFTAGGDGVYDFYTVATDNVGNVEGVPGTYDATTTVDATAPGAPSNIVCAPGHERVTVTWDDPSDCDDVEIWRAFWHDGSLGSVYPEYDDHPTDVIPLRPATRAAADASSEWTLAGTVSAGVETFDDDVTTRGVYYYEVFGKDDAGNYGPPATANDRATNYWLGDVTNIDDSDYDGVVSFFDISYLSDTYWLPTSDPDYKNECDVGPTDDNGPFGVPTTDDPIDFEDLMIFGMNYGVGEPKSYPVALAGRPEAGLPTLTLLLPGVSPSNSASFEAALVLGGNRDQVKGASIVLRFDPARLAYQGWAIDPALSAGVLALCAETEPGTIRLDLAVLGPEATLHGSGEIAKFRFTSLSKGDPAVRIAEASLRDAANGELAVGFAERESGRDLPAANVTRLVGAQPNPFNPTTSISFELTKPETVLIEVYDAQGRLVRTLLNESRSAGVHEATWDGRDGGGRSVGSGLYFVKMKAGEYRAVSKIVLVR